MKVITAAESAMAAADVAWAALEEAKAVGVGVAAAAAAAAAADSKAESALKEEWEMFGFPPVLARLW